MDPLFEVLQNIRLRPGMYLRKANLFYLKAFINGFIDKQFELDPSYRNQFQGFSEYVQKKHSTAMQNQEWDFLIDFYSPSDEVSLKNFFSLLDNYVVENALPDKSYPPSVSEMKHRILEFNSLNLDQKVNGYQHSGEKPFITTPFKSINEFKDVVNYGGEIEFTYQSKNYSITHVEQKICFCEVGNSQSKQLFEEVEFLLEYAIDNEQLIDIILKIKPYFRTF